MLLLLVSRGLQAKRRRCARDATPSIHGPASRTIDVAAKAIYPFTMRKRIVSREDAAAPAAETLGGEWLDLEALATAEVTSEDPAHPIEGALVDGAGGPWRASKPGEQVLTIRFDAPRRLTRISLLIVEETLARTQEIVIAWSADGREYREIVRQQWNFSPQGATRELEEYRVDLEGATALQVTVRPEIGGGEAIASITQLRLA